MNPLRQIRRLGQSLWLDYIRRDLLTSGELNKLITVDGISGVTSNPTIFAKALSDDHSYDSLITELLRNSPDLDSRILFEQIEVSDIRLAADILRPVYGQTRAQDGYVSIEVDPRLAYDPDQSIHEAQRLWREVGRPNVMVKIPATVEGLSAIEELVAQAINVNVTLIFSVGQYEQVIEAYLRGAERCGGPRQGHSVASFFVSRVDTAVDRALEEVGTEDALALRGKTGIANAQLAYRRFLQVFSGSNGEKLRSRGINIQKPLWASTGTKNKAYSDVLYVENLIAPNTINAMPPETVAAFRDHGQAREILSEETTKAQDIIGKLVSMQIIPYSIGQALTEEGVEKFQKSHDELIAVLDKKRAIVLDVSAA
jgi:transaldolase